MKIIINDELTKKMKEVNDIKYIPRVGERIYLGYNPSAEITMIVHDYEHQIIFITCNGDNK